MPTGKTQLFGSVVSISVPGGNQTQRSEVAPSTHIDAPGCVGVDVRREREGRPVRVEAGARQSQGDPGVAVRIGARVEPGARVVVAPTAVVSGGVLRDDEVATRRQPRGADRGGDCDGTKPVRAMHAIAEPRTSRREHQRSSAFARMRRPAT